MAEFVAAVGGTSILGTVASVASIGSTLLGAASQARAGEAAEIQAKQQAELEGIKARDAAIERRERLINALAHQNAKVGASGITGATPSQVMLEDVRQFEKEDFAQDTLSKVRQRNIVTAGKAKASSAKVGAGISLLKGAGDWYEAHGR